MDFPVLSKGMITLRLQARKTEKKSFSLTIY